MKKQLPMERCMFGKPRGRQRGEPKPSSHAPRWVLILGCTAAVCFCAMEIRHGRTVPEIPSDAVSVMALSHPACGVPTEGEPAGFLDGEWNLWEYLSDVLSALLIG